MSCLLDVAIGGVSEDWLLVLGQLVQLLVEEGEHAASEKRTNENNVALFHPKNLDVDLVKRSSQKKK